MSDRASGQGGLSPNEDEIDRALRELSEKMAAERGRATKQARQAAKRTQREARAARNRVRRAQAGKATLTVAAIALVVGGVAFGWWHYGTLTKGSPNDTGLVTGGAVPNSSNSSAKGDGALSPGGALSSGVPADGGPPADPFTGTPADGWANGAAGIALPVPEPTGSFSAAQVEAVYQTTRSLLVAQNLERATLLGGAPTAFANLLDPKERTQFVADLDKMGLAKDDTPESSRAWVASFAPGSTVLIGNVIKVHGTMSAKEAVIQGSQVIEVNVNYRFVYAVEPPRAPQDWMRIVGQVTGTIQFTNWNSTNGALLPWVVSAFPAEAGGRCGMADGYIHPDYPNGPPDAVQPSGKAIDPYSMATPQSASSASCSPTTGT
jgi:hypothetical protein